MTRPDTATKDASDVSAMFDEVSPRYDLLNDVLSMGSTRLWRIATTRAIAPRKGMRVLDIAAGTCTSSEALTSHGAHVTAADFSEGMLAEGRRRHAGNDLIEFVHADATALPFEDDSFDAATISYGLRNVNDPKKAVAEMVRVVKPGGRIVIAEFSRPTSEVMNWAYKKYNRIVLPRVAGLINPAAAEAYKYLNESIEEWPAQDELAAWLREAGLEHVAYRNLSGGIVALHRGFVPRKSAEKPSSPTAAAEAEGPQEPQEASSASTEKPAAKKVTKPAAAKPASAKPATAKQKSQSATKPKAGSAKPKASSTAPKKVDPAKATAKNRSQSAQQSNKSAQAKPAQAKSAQAKPAADSQPSELKQNAAATKQPATKQPAPKKPAAQKPAAQKPAPKKPAPKKPESNEGITT